MNFLSLNNISIKKIKELVERALFLKNNPNLIPKLKLDACLIFFEPSTRTRLSFQKALYLTSFHYLDLPTEHSSFLKKETLYDTVLTIKQMGISTFIIRSGENNYYKPLLKINDINLINGGDGIMNHPSQSLLDLVTIYEHFKRLNCKVFLCSYEPITNYQDLDLKIYNLNDIIEDLDVVMFLRIQHGRLSSSEKNNKIFETPESYNSLYGLNEKNYLKLKENAIFLHPGPVNNDWEIAKELVYAKKSKILPQITNGLYARVAILEYISNNKENN